jgi:hypothetical protein
LDLLSLCSLWAKLTIATERTDLRLRCRRRCRLPNTRPKLTDPGVLEDIAYLRPTRIHNPW